MNNSLLIKEILQNTKTIAMVGVSSVKEDVPNETIIRRPSNIVMNSVGSKLPLTSIIQWEVIIFKKSINEIKNK